MGYQIDQSGKIEQTERTTVVACVNGKKITKNRDVDRLTQEWIPGDRRPSRLKIKYHKKIKKSRSKA